MWLQRDGLPMRQLQRSSAVMEVLIERLSAWLSVESARGHSSI